MKMKAENFNLIVKGWQLSKGEALLENAPVKAKISRDQVDWFSSLEEELTQVQEDLNFYDNYLEKFTAEDIVSLGLDSRGNITQESSAIMTTADATTIADITAGAVILDDAITPVALTNFLQSCDWNLLIISKNGKQI